MPAIMDTPAAPMPPAPPLPTVATKLEKNRPQFPPDTLPTDLRIQERGDWDAWLVPRGSLLPLDPLGQLRGLMVAASTKKPPSLHSLNGSDLHWVLGNPGGKMHPTRGAQWWSTTEFTLVYMDDQEIVLRDCYSLVIRRGGDPHFACITPLVMHCPNHNPRLNQLETAWGNISRREPQGTPGYTNGLATQGAVTVDGDTLWVPDWLFMAYQNWIRASQMTVKNQRALPLPTPNFDSSLGGRSGCLWNGRAGNYCWGSFPVHTWLAKDCPTNLTPTARDLWFAIEKQKLARWFQYRDRIEPYLDSHWGFLAWDVSPLRDHVGNLDAVYTTWTAWLTKEKRPLSAVPQKLKVEMLGTCGKLPGWRLSREAPTWVRTDDDTTTHPVQPLDTSLPSTRVDWGQVVGQHKELAKVWICLRESSPRKYLLPDGAWTFKTLLRYFEMMYLSYNGGTQGSLLVKALGGLHDDDYEAVWLRMGGWKHCRDGYIANLGDYTMTMVAYLWDNRNQIRTILELMEGPQSRPDLKVAAPAPSCGLSVRDLSPWDLQVAKILGVLFGSRYPGTSVHLWHSGQMLALLFCEYLHRTATEIPPKATATQFAKLAAPFKREWDGGKIFERFLELLGEIHMEDHQEDFNTRFGENTGYQIPDGLQLTPIPLVGNRGIVVGTGDLTRKCMRGWSWVDNQFVQRDDTQELDTPATPTPVAPRVIHLILKPGESPDSVDDGLNNGTALVMCPCCGSLQQWGAMADNICISCQDVAERWENRERYAEEALERQEANQPHPWDNLEDEEDDDQDEPDNQEEDEEYEDEDRDDDEDRDLDEEEE